MFDVYYVGLYHVANAAEYEFIAGLLAAHFSCLQFMYRDNYCSLIPFWFEWSVLSSASVFGRGCYTGLSVQAETAVGKLFNFS